MSKNELFKRKSERGGENGPDSDMSGGAHLCCISTTSDTAHLFTLHPLLPPSPSPHTSLCLANRDDLMEGVT